MDAYSLKHQFFNFFSMSNLLKLPWLDSIVKYNCYEKVDNLKN
jgi:hypothetical protein